MDIDNVLLSLTEVAHGIASQYLIGTKDQLLTTFVLQKADNSSDVIGAPWEDDKQKKAMVFEVCMQIVKSEARILAYSFLTEAWIAHRTQAEVESGNIFPKPRDDPKRREAVVCIASDGTRHKHRTWEIGRDKSGKCVSLTEMPEPLQFGSWITEGLDKAMDFRAGRGAN